mgnify:CR=1 FL=1
MYSRKEIWRISLPILVSLFVQNLINITDTAFMGRVGQVELGASALAGVLYLAFYMVTFGFSTGAQILMARRNGEAQYRTLGPIMGQGILFLEIFSIILIFASLIGTPQMLKGLISSAAVCQAGENYMQYRIFGLLFTSIGVMFRAFFVAVTRTKVLMINAVIMTVANVVFNYIFVFGHFGAPEMGIAGAALGSVLAEATAALHFFLYTFFYIDRGKYQAFRRIRPHSRNTECIGMEHDSLLSHHRHMVSLFRSRRTFGRTSTGHFQHYPQHLYPAVHASQCFWSDSLYPREQCYGSPPSRRCNSNRAAYRQNVLRHSITPHCLAMLSSSLDTPHLYQR